MVEVDGQTCPLEAPDLPEKRRQHPELIESCYVGGSWKDRASIRIVDDPFHLLAPVRGAGDIGVLEHQLEPGEGWPTSSRSRYGPALLPEG